MAVPSDPTVAEIVTEGLKRGGLPNPDATQITDATTHQFREVKSDFMTMAGRSPILRTVGAGAHAKYEIEVAQPTDCDTVDFVEMFDVGTGKGGDTTGWRGTSVAGSTTTITLLGTLNLLGNDAAEIIGKYVLMSSGDGASQYGSITGYNDTTQVATLDRTITSPGTNTGYIVGKERYMIYSSDEPTAITTQLRQRSTELGLPRKGWMIGEKLHLDRIPDVQLGFLWTYYVDMDRLDETGATLIKLIREYRSVFVQGVAVKVMQRYDDSRYDNEVLVYQTMLDLLNQKAVALGKTSMNRDAQIIDALILQSGRLTTGQFGSSGSNNQTGFIGQRTRFGNR